MYVAPFTAPPYSSHAHFADRTVRLLGQGTFGKVIEAVDTETSQRVAIKIIRAIPKYRDASKIEVRVLQKLKERDPTNKQYVYRMLWRSLRGVLTCDARLSANAFICCTGSTTGITYASSQSSWACVYTTS